MMTRQAAKWSLIPCTIQKFLFTLLSFSGLLGIFHWEIFFFLFKIFHDMTLKPLLPVCLPVSFYCSDLLKIFIFPAAAAAWMNFDCSCGWCHGTIASCRLSLRILQEKAAVVRLALTILNSDSNWTKYSDNIFPKGPNSSSGYFQSDWLCYFPAHDHCNKGFLHAAFHKPRQLPEKRQYFPTIITPHYSKRNSTLSETA